MTARYVASCLFTALFPQVSAHILSFLAEKHPEIEQVNRKKTPTALRTKRSEQLGPLCHKVPPSGALVTAPIRSATTAPISSPSSILK